MTKNKYKKLPMTEERIRYYAQVAEEFSKKTEMVKEKDIDDLKTVEIEIHAQTIIAMYLGNQLNAHKKVLFDLYEKERHIKKLINELAALDKPVENKNEKQF
jgi:hypothetical protein